MATQTRMTIVVWTTSSLSFDITLWSHQLVPRARTPSVDSTCLVYLDAQAGPLLGQPSALLTEQDLKAISLRWTTKLYSTAAMVCLTRTGPIFKGRKRWAGTWAGHLHNVLGRNLEELAWYFPPQLVIVSQEHGKFLSLSGPLFLGN